MFEKRMKVAALALLTAGLTGAAQPSPTPNFYLRAVEQPSERQVARCFRGLEAPSVRFAMTCTLDSRGVARQCQAHGLSEPQIRMLEERVNCIGAQFRYERSDGGPLEGLSITMPLNYQPAF